MKKTYVTFGQDHVHNVNGKRFDKDTVAVIEAENAEEGRLKAFDYFGKRFCFEFFDKQWNDRSLKFFPKGLVPVEGKVNDENAPRRDNDKFNHDAEDFIEATGISGEMLNEVIEKINDSITPEMAKKKSMCIEQIYKNTTHKELAALFHAMQQRYAKREAAREFRDFNDFLGKMFRD